MYNDNDATQHVLIGNLRACHFPYYVITGLSYISPRHDRGRTELRPSQSITSCHMTLNVYKLPHNQIFYVSAYQLSSLTPSSNRWCPQTSNSLETKIPPASSDSKIGLTQTPPTSRDVFSHTAAILREESVTIAYFRGYTKLNSKRLSGATAYITPLPFAGNRIPIIACKAM